MSINDVRKDTYESVLEEKLGKNFIVKENVVKQNQCYKCAKRGKNECRLNFKNDKCVNYEKRG